MGLLSSGLSTWSMVGQSSLASAAEAASPFCFESRGEAEAKAKEKPHIYKNYSKPQSRMLLIKNTLILGIHI